MKTISTMKTIKIILLTLAAGATLSACKMQPSGSCKQLTPATETKVQPVKVMDLIYRETAISQTITSTVVAFEETYPFTSPFGPDPFGEG